MGKIIISNVNDEERNWDSSLNWKHFEQDDEHKHSFELQRSAVSNPVLTNGKLEVYFYTIPPGKVNFPYHYHTVNEEVFHIMSGQGTLRTP